MKALVVYDSQSGNTKKIAEVVAIILKGKIFHVTEVKIDDIKGSDILVVGSPTHGGRPTPATVDFINKIPSDLLKNIKCASFDTRFDINDLGFFLKTLIKTIGYASPKISAMLKNKGGKVSINPEGFFVDNKKGVLKEGEIKRVSVWSKKIITD